MSNGPIEPAAEMRKFAAGTYEIYTALSQSGFTAQEALTIIGQMIAASMGDAK